jgi:hypothetical protein
VRLIGNGWQTTIQKILLSLWAVKRKIGCGNSLGFQAQINDFRLKWCILGKNPKNKITGRTGCLCRGNLPLPPDLTLMPSQYRESEKRVENYGLKAITRSSMRAILRVASDALFEPLFPDQHRAWGCGLFLP